jgi:hypothetical protein
MRNKKPKNWGLTGSNANLLEHVKAAIPLHYTLVCTFQMHFNSFLLSICSPKDYMSAQSAPTPPRRLRVRPITAHAQYLNFFPKKTCSRRDSNTGPSPQLCVPLPLRHV